MLDTAIDFFRSHHLRTTLDATLAARAAELAAMRRYSPLLSPYPPILSP